MVNEMEKSGIPTALITNMTAVARSIGSPRVIPGIAINNPCSDIDLPMEEQLKMRRNYIDRRYLRRFRARSFSKAHP